MRKWDEISTEHLGLDCLWITEIILCLIVGSFDSLICTIIKWVIVFALVWTLAIRFYNNYKTKTVKILYWTVFSVITVSLALFLFIPRRVALLIILFLGYGEIIAGCVVYMQKVKTAPTMTDSRNGAEVKLRGLKRDSFAPMAWGTFAIFFLTLLGFQHIKHLNEWIMCLVGGGIGLLIGVGVIVFFAVLKRTTFLK